MPRSLALHVWLCALFAIGGLARAESPWGSAAETETEKQAVADGLLADGDESSGWYKKRSVHEQVKKQIRAHEREAKLRSTATPRANQQVEELKLLGEAAAAKKKVKGISQLAKALAIQRAENAKEREQETALATELGESAEAEQQMSADISSRARQMARKLHSLLQQAKRGNVRKRRENAQKLSYAHEVNMLGEDRHRQAVAKAELAEGAQAELLDNALEVSAEKAGLASIAEAKSNAKLEKEMADIRQQQHAHSESMHREIKAKFNVDALKAKDLVEQGQLIDDDARRHNVENIYNQYLAGLAQDQAGDAAPALQAEYNLQRSEAIKNLPSIHQAEATANSVVHPCGAVDTLEDDPLCTLTEKTKEAFAAAQHAIVHDESGGFRADHHDVEEGLVALQVGESEAAGFVTLHAKEAERRFTQANEELHRKASEMANRLDFGAEQELEQYRQTGAAEAAQAWKHAQASLSKERAAGLSFEQNEPRLMRERQTRIIAGALRHKAKSESKAMDSEAEDLHQDAMRRFSELSTLTRGLVAAQEKEHMETTAGRHEMQRILKHMEPHVPSALEMEMRDDAAQRLKAKEQRFTQIVKTHNHISHFRQEEELRALNVAHSEMRGEQKLVDSAALHEAPP